MGTCVKLTYETTGSPASNVSVTAYWDTSYETAVSDSNGVARFTANVPTTSLWVTKEGVNITQIVCPTPTPTPTPAPTPNCYIGDNVYVIDTCTAAIVSGGKLYTERFVYPSDVNYGIYILKTDSACGPVGGGTVYLEYWNGSSWVTISQNSASGGYGYSYMVWDIVPGGWAGKMRLRWDECVKEWQQSPIITTPTPTVTPTPTPAPTPTPTPIPSECYRGAIIYKSTCPSSSSYSIWTNGVGGSGTSCYASLADCKGYIDTLYTIGYSFSQCLYVTPTPTPTPTPVPTGSIYCTSSPSGAAIYLSLANTGKVTPDTLTDLSPGTYFIEYKKTGYNVCSGAIGVIAGQTTNAPCTLVLTPTPTPTPVPTKDTMLCAFSIKNDKEADTIKLSIGLTYSLRIYLYEASIIGCLFPLKTPVEGRNVLFYLDSIQIGSVITTSGGGGYAAINYTPTASHIGTGKTLYAKFTGDTQYNGIQDVGIKVDIKALDSFEVTVTNIAVQGIQIWGMNKDPLGCFFGWCGVGCYNEAMRKIDPPVPSSKTFVFTSEDKFEVGKEYAFVAVSTVLGIPVPPFFLPETQFVKMLSGVNKVSIVGYAVPLPWESWLCELFGVADIDCADAVRSFGRDIIYSAESWSRITKYQNLDGSYAAPGILDYIFAGLDMLPFVGSGVKFTGKLGIKVVSMFGSKIAKIAEHVPKADIAAWMNVVGVDNLVYTLARVSDEHIDELLRYLDAANFNAATAWVSKYFSAPDVKATKATIKSFSDQINQIYDIFRGEGDNIVREVKAGEVLSKGAVEVAADYADDVVKLRGFYKDSVLVTEIVRIDDVVTKNPAEWLKVLNPATGISLSDLHLVEGLVTSGNAKKLKDAGKLDGFLKRFTDAVSLQPSKYRELMKAYSDAEIKAISDELIAAGKAAEAGIYTSIKEVQKASVSGGLFDGLKNVAVPLEAAGKAGGKVAEAGGKILDDAVKAIPPNTADDAVFDKVLKTDNHTYFPASIRLWTWIKYKASEVGLIWSSMTLREKLTWYAKYIMLAQCFALFIVEEAAQQAGFAYFISTAEISGWAKKTVVQKQAVINTLTATLDGIEAIHNVCTVQSYIYGALCPFMAPAYYTFFKANELKIASYRQQIEDLKKDINPLTGLGIATVKLTCNVDNVIVYIGFFETNYVAGKYPIYLNDIPVRDTPYDLVVAGCKSGYLLRQEAIRINPTDSGKTLDLYLELTPESDVPGGVTNPFPCRRINSPETISNQSKPYGDADPNGVFNNVGDIYCSSTPQNAAIWLDGADQSRLTTWTLKSIAVGSHKVTLKLTRYKDCGKTVIVMAGKTTQADCTLESACSTPNVGISYTPTSPKVYEAITFTGSVSEADASKMKKWEWNFGDGDTRTGITTQHTYSVDGMFTVKLTVTNECDVLFSFSKSITVSKALGTINCLCTGDYCAAGLDIYIDGVIQGLKTTDKPYYRSFDVATGAHTVKYNLVDVLIGSKDITVPSGVTVSVDIEPVGVLDPAQVGVTTTITGIIDGDTITTAATGAREIRMVGYDAPESGTDAGKQATALLTSLIPLGSPITLKVWKYRPLDLPKPGTTYLRILGGIFVSATDIALEMLKSCLVEKTTYTEKFYWVDYGVYNSQYCDNTLYGSMTVKAYDVDKNLLIGVKVFVDNIDKGDAPITVNSLLAGTTHTLRLEKASYTGCKYCHGVGCAPVTQISPCQFSVTIIKGQVVTYEIAMMGGATPPPPSVPETFDAAVTAVIDGDTIKILYNTKTYECRLVGINAPEGSGESYLVRRLTCPTCTEDQWNANSTLYNTIKTWANTTMFGKTLTFKTDSSKQYDSFGRLLIVPFDGTVNICKKELELGYAAVFFYDTNKCVNTTEFIASEKIARDAYLGVWFKSGTVHCISHPTAADVWLDGIDTGHKTSSSVYDLTKVTVGTHTVTFKKYIDGIFYQCSVDVTVPQDGTVNAECTLQIAAATPTPTPGPTHTPTPTPTPTPAPSKAIWHISQAKDGSGTDLSSAKVYVDDVYIGHYTPEDLTFCPGCKCDTVVSCELGSHVVKVIKTDYRDWSKTRTLVAGDDVTDSPVLLKGFPVTINSYPAGASVEVDDVYAGVGRVKVFKGNLIERMMDKLKEANAVKSSGCGCKDGAKK